VVREGKSVGQAERADCSYEVHERLLTHLDLEQHAFRLLKTDQADFVYLHFSIPHSPNVWSRIDGNYTPTCDSSYIDNLALVEIELQRILDTLKASPRWEETNLIVQGDHSWRIHLWDWLPAWTDEDDHASRGEFDTRPALLVHLAGQTAPRTNSTAWPVVQVHDVADEIVRGEKVKF
jgi:membrane-anchored protein YejM (alkaline phosphatase superfamily)